MYHMRHALILAALALPLSAVADDKKALETKCDTVNWSKEVLEAFPNAQRGCQQITSRGDTVYAQYKGVVAATDKESITVFLKDRDGKNMTKIKFGASDDMVKVNDKDVKFRDLKEGTTLRFYMPHNRWGLFSSPEGGQFKVISSEPM